MLTDPQNVQYFKSLPWKILANVKQLIISQNHLLYQPGTLRTQCRFGVLGSCTEPANQIKTNDYCESDGQWMGCWYPLVHAELN